MKTSSSATHLIAIAAIVGAVSAGFATGPAFAQTKTIATEDFSFAFTYDPAELATVQSAEKLLVRLQQKVRAHCGEVRMMKLEERAQVKACARQTMRDSIDKFRSPTLAQAYETRAGG